MIPRLLLPGSHGIGDRIDADPQAAHYLARVLRVGAGDAVQVFDGNGHRHAARVEQAGRDRVVLRIERALAAQPESPLHITLLQALSSAEKMDWTIEKAVELGVTRIVPLDSARSQVRLDRERAARRLAHWERIAVAACMQCGRDRLPRIGPIGSIARLEDALAGIAGERLVLAAPPSGAPADPDSGPDPGAARAVGRPTPQPDRVPAALPLSHWQPARPGGPAPESPVSLAVVLLVGPESGLAPDEVDRAVALGFVPVSLGPRTLRTETAALAAVAALQVKYGDF
jgi:16S rRNA (uracil1498-N3)-methyltransferase